MKIALSSHPRGRPCNAEPSASSPEQATAIPSPSLFSDFYAPIASLHPSVDPDSLTSIAPSACPGSGNALGTMIFCHATWSETSPVGGHAASGPGFFASHSAAAGSGQAAIRTPDFIVAGCVCGGVVMRRPVVHCVGRKAIIVIVKVHRSRTHYGRRAIRLSQHKAHD